MMRPCSARPPIQFTLRTRDGITGLTNQLLGKRCKRSQLHPEELANAISQFSLLRFIERGDSAINETNRFIEHLKLMVETIIWCLVSRRLRTLRGL
jgi:hypothetical protein